MKTVRFPQVVQKCGAPEIHLAWVSPNRDSVLKKALGENRVMTVHQELRGGKKDYGTVGFLKGRNSQILLFPKSLRRFTERRIVAIDYSLLAKGGTPAGEKGNEKSKPSRAAKVPSRLKDNSRFDQSLRPATPRIGRSRVTKQMIPSVPVRPARIVHVAWPPAKILAEVKRARDELAAGKSVPAYERLKRLLAEAQSSDDRAR
jgi:hypothetical protein